MFIKEGSDFPPKNWKYWIDKYNEYATWYSADQKRLMDYYKYKIDNKIFWGRDANEETGILNLPLAADIAGVSANLLFSEIPKLEYDNDEIIDEFIEENGFYNKLLEAAEIAAALSGVFLKLDIDTSITDVPILNIMTPQYCFPYFYRGRLKEILFYRTVLIEKEGTVHYRLFENRRNENNTLYIEFKLYKGSEYKIGKVVDINSIEETARLGLNDITFSNMRGLGVVYVPNMKPNKLDPGSDLGSNDFGTCIPMLGGLDFAYTSWIRDIELGMGQIFIDNELLRNEEEVLDSNINAPQLNPFSKFQKAFLKLNMSQRGMAGENYKPIEIVQFEMRVEEHLKTCNDWIKQIITSCGYSPQTFGYDINGQAESGTALRMRERKSFLNREKKSRYWQQAIKELLLQTQNFYYVSQNKIVESQDVNVELEDSIIIDYREQSEVLRNLDQARSISLYTKVAMQHPDWNAKQIDEEVKMIQNEQGIEMADTMFNLET
jgi:hypothetical protein